MVQVSYVYVSQIFFSPSTSMTLRSPLGHKQQLTPQEELLWLIWSSLAGGLSVALSLSTIRSWLDLQHFRPHLGPPQADAFEQALHTWRSTTSSSRDQRPVVDLPVRPI